MQQIFKVCLACCLLEVLYRCFPLPYESPLPLLFPPMPAASMGIMDLHLSCSCFDFGALAAGWVATNVRMAEYAGGPHAKATLQAVPARRVELVVGARERRAVRCTVAPIGARIFAAPRLFRLHGVAWFVVASILVYLRHLAAFESSLSRFEPVAFVLAFANDAVPSQSLERKIVPLAKRYFGEL